ncbi:interactor of constitutive active ROPs 2, chloroplastic-like [Papaver somniferum]|uniref:interactor of constitutive active ROPs 2, chloroplastic-like n=1 Tax=Papaver somniferum TaxID=3469 RepID=UPI000E6FFDEF|nr:interactor of constitutive active ROPs 2, chloroplastic-like [Papaver somniferum]
MKSNVTKWVVRIRRVDGIAEDEKITRDVDWNSDSNRAARRSNDSSWLNFPVILEGSFISGRAADGSDNLLPEDFPLYHPWEFKLLENEEKKVADAKRVNSLDDKTLGKSKITPKKRASKSESKKTSLKDDISRKRARYESSASSETSDRDTFVSEEEVSIDSYRKKSDLFSGDSLATIGDDETNRSFKMISEICISARISYAISLDNERKLRRLQDENAKLKHEKSILSDVNANLIGENTKLKNENLTDSQLILQDRERNKELIDEAANLPDAETLLEHLNSSLNNYPIRGFENLSLEELRLKYTTLSERHKNALSAVNNFKRRFYEEREAIQVLEAKKNDLITQKHEIALRGAKALEQFQESIIEVKIERDSDCRERDTLIEERNLIQSQLLIKREAEFNWAARVLNDARYNLEKEKVYQKSISELKTRLAAKEEESSSRNSKYQQLKQNWFNLVQNNSNDANRSREAAVKRSFKDDIFASLKISLPSAYLAYTRLKALS